jgi:hypothetical protein
MLWPRAEKPLAATEFLKANKKVKKQKGGQTKMTLHIRYDTITKAGGEDAENTRKPAGGVVAINRPAISHWFELLFSGFKASLGFLFTGP